MMAMGLRPMKSTIKANDGDGLEVNEIDSQD
jgi:hypothetical protein